jgi:hypothetical protein
MLRVAANFPEDKSMDNGSALDMDAHDINPVALERVARPPADHCHGRRSLPRQWPSPLLKWRAIADLAHAADNRRTGL